jgi:hypothetical protein
VTRRLREHGPALAFAGLGVWAMTFLGLYGFGWNDYENEVLPAYDALTAGHVWSFLTLAPAYGGSLEMRAPFAFLPGLFGGREVAVYQAVSVPCLIVAALFAVWLLSQMRALGHNRLARATVLGLCVVNPVTLQALQWGHAEELLGAVLCVAAVLAAQRGHAGWSGILLGLAIANKQWALLAVGPVLVALPAHRWRATGVAAAVALCFYIPLWLAAYSSSSSGGVLAATNGGVIFQPWQLWWFLGSTGHVVHGLADVLKVGYRTPPAWIETYSHPLIVALSVPATLLAVRRGSRDALLLLTFLLAIRFAFDPWDFVYYPLPFIFALLVWETMRWRRVPVFALTASVVVWFIFVVLPSHVSADAQAAAFLVVTLPTLFALAVGLYAPGMRLRTVASPRHAHSSAPATTPISTM